MHAEFPDIQTGHTNTELTDLRKTICFGKSEASDERMSLCNVIENVAERGINYLPCSYTNDVIDMLALQLWRH